jgi:cytochrome c oxidase subunit II
MKKVKIGFLVGLVALLILVAGCSKGGANKSTGAAVVEGVKEFDVIAKQFEFVPSTIKVKQGDTVRLKVTSVDVDHGVAIPQFGVNKGVPGGQTVLIEFVADRKGEFPLICSVYCGSGHMNHRGLLVVE